MCFLIKTLPVATHLLDLVFADNACGAEGFMRNYVNKQLLYTIYKILIYK